MQKESDEDIIESAPKGWRPLVKSLIEDIYELGWDGELSQIKEKFGGLRFYIGNASKEIHNRIDLAELQSLVTCEKCGLPGERSSWGGYWISTLCENHGRERTLEVEAMKKLPTT